MTDAKRLAQACNNYGITGGLFYAACTLLAENGIENALEFVRKVAICTSNVVIASTQ